MISDIHKVGNSSYISNVIWEGVFLIGKVSE